MDATSWMVVGSSLVLGVGVGAFFLAPRKAAAARKVQGGVSTADLTVDGGYSPGALEVAAGQPLQLNVLRTDASFCTSELVFPDLGISRQLPTGEVVRIDLPALQPGRYDFTCGMRMLRGQLNVK